MTIDLGCLVPVPRRKALPPEAQPLGRAALQLFEEGVDIVFGEHTCRGRLAGSLARPGQWIEVDRTVAAVFDRYPRRKEPWPYRRALAGLVGVPVLNGTTISDLCSDKIRTQRLFEGAGLAMPPIETDSLRFASALAGFKVGFIKPRYGACGCGIARVQPGDPLPARGEGAVVGVLEPLFLQASVGPPAPWAGISVRVLCQRETGGWVPNDGVARRSSSDWIVSASRGAEVAAMVDVLPRATTEDVHDLVLRACSVLAAAPGGDDLLEVGVDAVIDCDYRPHLIEVNSRPWG
ncbi:MAG: hypothetical protein HN348_14510, partial [Proteobacteria bacterium]|nr:hypothetical protein [Pseudomonadota bacterium]